ncbi:hypothetical protein IAD21_05842 [Abditibacteriota bacterium]|nr:hypothetical protein IAD21_05842 [Abditibacteriota bacterium]
MKNTGICPKCESQEIVHVAEMGYHYIPISTFKGVAIARYICTHCGYCEEWIDSPEDREKLKDRYNAN